MLVQPFANPMIIASALGVVVALTGWEHPDLLQKPIDMLAGGAVPMVLLAFGLSLAGRAPLQKGDGRIETLVATFLKIAGHAADCLGAGPVRLRAGRASTSWPA